MDLSWVKRRRGAAQASVTRLKKNVDKLEAKSELTRTDRLMVSCLIKKLEDWDAKFRKLHNVVLDLTEDESDGIEWERSIFDEHDEKVTQLSVRLQVLGYEEEEEVESALTSHDDTSQHLGRRLRYVSDVMENIRESIDGLFPGCGFENAFCKSWRNGSTSSRQSCPRLPVTYYARRTTMSLDG